MSLASAPRRTQAEDIEGIRRDAGAVARGTQILVAMVVVVSAALAGRLVAEAAQLHSLPWVLARALGITALVSLTGLVCWGMWIRHPWRRYARLRPATVSRVHASLALATVLAALGHAASLAVDPYVEVGWRGAVVPFASGYRTSAVTLGVLALYGLLVTGLTARMARSWVGRHWRAVHRYALWCFWVAWLHGVNVGSDTAALSWIYVAAGALVVATWVSKRVAGTRTVVERGAR